MSAKVMTYIIAAINRHSCTSFSFFSLRHKNAVCHVTKKKQKVLGPEDFLELENNATALPCTFTKYWHLRDMLYKIIFI